MWNVVTLCAKASRPPGHVQPTVHYQPTKPGGPAAAIGIRRFGGPDDPVEKRTNFYVVGTMAHGTLIDAATGDTCTWDVLRQR